MPEQAISRLRIADTVQENADLSKENEMLKSQCTTLKKQFGVFSLQQLDEMAKNVNAAMKEGGDAAAAAAQPEAGGEGGDAAAASGACGIARFWLLAVLSALVFSSAQHPDAPSQLQTLSRLRRSRLRALLAPADACMYVVINCGLVSARGTHTVEISG